MPYRIKNIVFSADCIKCDMCCYFDQNEADCTPCFTIKEFASVPLHLQKNLTKDDTGFYRPLLITPQKNNEYSACPFLMEESHECGIYGFRPLDCELWPFRFAYRQAGRQDVSLVVVSEEVCPAMNNKISVATESIGKIIRTLQTRGVFGEIVRGERHVYDEMPFHIHLRSLEEFLG